MFPKSNHFPTLTPKGRRLEIISPAVVSDLLDPPIAVHIRLAKMLWTTVPKTTIHKDAHPCAPEDQVCPARDSAIDLAVLAEPEPPAVQRASQNHLQTRVRRTIGLHNTADDGRGCRRCSGSNGFHRPGITSPASGGITSLVPSVGASSVRLMRNVSVPMPICIASGCSFAQKSKMGLPPSFSKA